MKNLNDLKKILIIEDDKDIRDGLTNLFECEGYFVEQAGNGQEAINCLSTLADAAGELPSVILLDLMMPVKDGFAFLQDQINCSNHRIRDIPVIVMTADAHINEKSKLIDAKASIRKPIDIEALLDTVKELINH